MKPTKPTAKTGEYKPTNRDLIQQMVKISNNSQLTQQTANLLSNKLDADDIRKLLEWFYHANRQVERQIHNAKNKPSINNRF